MGTKWQDAITAHRATFAQMEAELSRLGMIEQELARTRRENDTQRQQGAIHEASLAEHVRQLQAEVAKLNQRVADARASEGETQRANATLKLRLEAAQQELTETVKAKTALSVQLQTVTNHLKSSEIDRHNVREQLRLAQRPGGSVRR